MGLLSKIWKGVKNVFKGVVNVFKKILKPIGKLLNSSLGKAIMIGLSIFTLGTAMIAGAGAFTSGMAAGNGFISSFVQGGKAFLTSLTGVGGKEAAKQGASGIGEAAAEQAAQVGIGETLMGGAQSLPMGDAAGAATQMIAPPAAAGAPAAAATTTGGGGGSLIKAAGAGANAGQGPTQALAQAGGELATRVPPAAEGNWLSKAAKAAGDFIQTPSGSNITGKVIEGVGNYYTSKDQQEFQDRIRRQWGDKSDPNVQDLRRSANEFAQTARTNAPNALAAGRNSAVTARTGNRRPVFASASRQPVPTGG